MSLTLSIMPRARRYASDDLAREIVGRVSRWALIAVGMVLILAGIAIAPLPGPLGVPVTVVGLMLVLRNSFKARRQFVRFAHAHPRAMSPIRRLLRREPEFLKVAWQQTLRIERLVLPKRRRFATRVRRMLRRRR